MGAGFLRSDRSLNGMTQAQIDRWIELNDKVKTNVITDLNAAELREYRQLEILADGAAESEVMAAAAQWEASQFSGTQLHGDELS